MAKSITLLTIFISGTSETDADRTALKGILQNLSQIIELTQNTSIRVVTWPDDFNPGVNEDPQMEIKRQLKNEYDIYLGLLGSRFGSPTPRAESGTVEELYDAIAQFHQDTSSLRVLFYFKKSNDNTLSLDTKQLQQVQDFKENLSELGVLYKEIKDTNELLEVVPKDLLKLIVNDWPVDRWNEIELDQAKIKKIIEIAEAERDLKKNEPQNLEEEILSNISDADDEDDDDDFYLIDTLQNLHEANESMIQNLNQMSEYTTKLGTVASSQSGEIEMINSRLAVTTGVGGSRQNQELVTQFSNVLNVIAEEMEDYSKKMNPHVTNLPAEINAFLENYSELYKYQRSVPDNQQNNDDIEKAFDTLESFVRTMSGTKDSIISFQSSVAELPAFTRKFKRARKRTSNTIGQLVAALTLGINKGQVILSELDQDTS